MFPKDYDSFDVKIESRENKKLFASAKAKANRYCSDCRDVAHVHKSEKHTVYDITEDGTVVEIQMSRTRYKCPSCGKTFWDQERPHCFADKSKLSRDLIEAAVDELIMSSDSIATVADKYEMGKTTLSDALNRRIEAKQPQISTLETPEVLIAYPFPYKNDSCYALFGITGYDSKTEPQREYLYDIRRGYSAREIQNFLKAHPFHRMCIMNAEFADDTPDVLSMFAALYKSIPENCVCVLRHFLKEKVKLIRDKYMRTRKETVSTVDDGSSVLSMLCVDRGSVPYCLDAFETCVEEDRSSESFLANVEEIWSWAISETQNALLPLYEELKNNSQTMNFTFCAEYKKGFVYDFEECEAVELFMQYIKTMCSHNTPFEQIRFRAITSNAAKNAEDISMQSFMHSSYSGEFISRFRIDLNDFTKTLIENIKNDLWPHTYTD